MCIDYKGYLSWYSGQIADLFLEASVEVVVLWDDDAVRKTDR